MKKIILIPLVSGIVVIVGIVSSLYTQVWNPSWNPFVSPDKILSEALEKMADLKTYSQKAEISISASGFEGLDNISFSIKGDIDVDVTLPENPKSSGDFQMDVSFAGISEQQLTPQITPFVIGGKLTLFLEGEAKQIGKEFYLKIKTIPFYPFLEPQLAMLGINLSEIKDNWIKIDPEAISQWTGVKYESLETEKTKNIQEEMENILKGKKILSVKSVLKDEKIDNTMCYHYLVSVNSEELKGFISEIQKEVLKEYSLEEEISKEELGEFYEKFDETWEKIGGIEFEIWFGKEDKFIRLISLEKEIDFEKFNSIKLSIGYSNLNKPISITTPTEYKSLQEVFEPILMMLMMQSQKVPPSIPAGIPTLPTE